MENRNAKQVQEEYDRLIYGPLLDHVKRAGDSLTPEDVLRVAAAQTAERNKLTPNEASRICVSFGDEFFETDLDTIRGRRRTFFLSYMRQIVEPFPTVVELGAGYGAQLYVVTQSFPAKACHGGDISGCAVELARFLFRHNQNVSIHHFNFYEPDSYRIFNDMEEPVLVYTSHAVEQLPSAKPLIDNLAAYREKIGAVVHFEPVYQPDVKTITGLMRARYMEFADYNRDLLVELAGRPDIRIVHQELNVIGQNPLNPTSIVHWAFGG